MAIPASCSPELAAFFTQEDVLWMLFSVHTSQQNILVPFCPRQRRLEDFVLLPLACPACTRALQWWRLHSHPWC